MIDTHCHINFDSYDDDRDAVIVRAAEAGIDRIINPAIDVETSEKILPLCERYKGLYAAVGIHPNDTANLTQADLDRIAALAEQPRVVAIGEIGLDYYWDKSPKEKQFEAFEAQLALAQRFGLPVIIHNREASEDVIRILESWGGGLPASLKSRPGVMHSFSGSIAIAERALAAGFYLGFTGPITFKKADETRAIAARVPLDRLLVETDGPFLTPAPHRGKRNEPAYVVEVARCLAGLHQTDIEEMARITTANFNNFFRLN